MKKAHRNFLVSPEFRSPLLFEKSGPTPPIHFRFSGRTAYFYGVKFVGKQVGEVQGVGQCTLVMRPELLSEKCRSGLE
jgi:hypothetical protein